MKIGIIGSGNIGGTFAEICVKAGHEVCIANSRGPETLTETVAQLGAKARAGTIEDAVNFGDVVLVAIPLKAEFELPSGLFKGKIVIDAGNYYPDRDGQIQALDKGETTSSQIFASKQPGARIVKAINTIYFKHLASQGDPGKPEDERRAVFAASDDAAAKRIVTALLEGLGFGVVDGGTLSQSVRLQPGSPVYNQELTKEEGAVLLAGVSVR